MKKIGLLFVVFSQIAIAQTFTKIDTLKGSDTKYRNFWDVKKYRLSVEPNISEKSLKGSNKIEFTITKDILNPTFQIDLQQPMKVEKLIASFPTIDGFKRDGDFIYINAKKKFKKGLAFDRDFRIIQFIATLRRTNTRLTESSRNTLRG